MNSEISTSDEKALAPQVLDADSVTVDIADVTLEDAPDAPAAPVSTTVSDITADDNHCTTEEHDELSELDVAPPVMSRDPSRSEDASSPRTPLGRPERERVSSTTSSASDRERRLSTDRTSVPVKSRGKIVSLNEYTIVKKIGQGAFAEVKLASLDGMFYAIKIIDVETIMKRRFGFGKPVDKQKTDEQMDDTAREIAIMKLMVHPNLIELYEVLRDEDNKHIYLVMEFMAGGPLMKYNPSSSRFKCTIPRTLLGNNQGVMNEYWCRRTFRALMSALGYLHCKFIVHRDLKPENIMTDLQGNIKIGDFGVSRHFSEESSKETISLKRLALSQSRGRVMGTEGTWCFYSPEMCQEKPTPYSAYMADVWAASVCLYVFVFNVLPFFHAEVRTLFREIREKDPTEIWPKNVSPELKDLLKKLFVKDVTQRLSIDDIVKHPWMLTEDSSEQMNAMEMFRESAEFTESDDEDGSSPGHERSKTMDTNFSDYFRTMCSELVSTSIMDIGDDSDDDDYHYDSGASRAVLETKDSSMYSLADSFMSDGSSEKDMREKDKEKGMGEKDGSKDTSPRSSKRRPSSSSGTPSMTAIAELENEAISPAASDPTEESGDVGAAAEQPPPSPKSCCVVS